MSASNILNEKLASAVVANSVGEDNKAPFNASTDDRNNSVRSSTGHFLAIGGRYTSGAPTYDNGDLGYLRITSDGKLMIDASITVGSVSATDVSINNGSGAAAVNIQDGGNSITVDGSVTANPTFPANAAVTSVAGSVTVVTLKASNSNRRGLTISNSKFNLYVKFGSGASLSDYTKVLAAGEDWTLPQPNYTGIVTGIWDNTDGSTAAHITEVTP